MEDSISKEAKCQRVLADFEEFGNSMHNEAEKERKDKERFKAMYDKAQMMYTFETENRKKFEIEIAKLKNELDAKSQKCTENASTEADLCAKILSLETENRTILADFTSYKEQNSLSSSVSSDLVREKDELIQRQGEIIRETEKKYCEERRKRFEGVSDVAVLVKENEEFRKKNEILEKSVNEKNPEQVKQIVEVEQMKKEVEFWKGKSEGKTFSDGDAFRKLETELKAAKEKCRNLEEQLKFKMEAENILQQTIEVTKTAKERFRNECDVLKKELTEKSKNIVDLETRVNSELEKNQNAKTDLGAKTLENEMLNKQLMEKSKHNESTVELKKVTDMSKEIQHMKHEIDEKTKEIEFLKKKLETVSDPKKIDRNIESQLKVEREAKLRLTKEVDEYRELLSDRLSQEEFLKKLPKHLSIGADTVKKLTTENKGLKEKLESQEKTQRSTLESFQELYRRALSPLET